MSDFQSKSERGRRILEQWHADRVPLGFISDLVAHQEKRIAELEAEVEQVIGERDRAQDALQQTHIALGGDGEWVAKPGQPCEPGSTGDLHVDVPWLAKARIADLEAQASRWVSLEERLPSCFQDVWVYPLMVSSIFCQDDEDGSWWFEDKYGYTHKGVTHWTPLPAPPTDHT